ncbi:hypothetical protein, partial [uncultured Faecalicoccus sp.]|uniref:hypothetical protein n=1 Tax=uncultured Faecalicoccus sp. TaxID=1971760 RepID=UPI0026174D52
KCHLKKVKIGKSYARFYALQIKKPINIGFFDYWWSVGGPKRRKYTIDDLYIKVLNRLKFVIM